MKSEGQLKRAAMTGAIWKFAERIIAQGTHFIVSLVVARLLAPEAYSVVAFVTIFITFANILISGGFNTSLMQKKEVDKEEYSSVFVASLVFSIVIYILIFFLAPPIARAYDEPDLVAIFRVMGLSMPIAAVKSIWCAYISVTMKFKKFFFATIGGTIASGVVGIWMAVKGYGAWALVAQHVTNTTIDTILLILSTRIGISLKVNWKKLKSLLSYGWKILASKLLNQGFIEANPIVLGLIYPKAALSFYTRGKSIPDIISSTSINSLAAVFMPFLAKFQDEKQKLLEYTRMFIRAASYVCFPLMLGFFAVADNFIEVVLTEKWMGAVPYIQVFCISAMFEMLAAGNNEAIKAMGRSDVFLIMEIIKEVSYVVIIASFIIFGKEPIMLAYSILVCSLVTIAVSTFPNRKLLGYKYKMQLADVIPNLILSAIMVAAVYAVNLLPIAKLWILLIQIVVGMTVYVGLSILTKNKSFKFLLRTGKSLLYKGSKAETTEENKESSED